MNRYVYLAGAVEVNDTWRQRAAEQLEKIGFKALDPIRGEKVKFVGKHVKSDIPDSLMIMRDLNDLERVRLSGGLVLMNLNTTSEGRRPTATLMELLWCWLNKLPIIAIMGKECSPEIKKHPWINVMVSAEVSSVTAGLELIERYFI